MKRQTALFLMLLFLLTLSACGGGQTSATDHREEADNGAPTEQQAATPAETANPANQPEADAQPTNESSAETGSRVLVVYFSCTGTTKGVAVTMADALNADIYEIVAEETYTADDLNYHDNNSRTTKEQNDKSVRPAISGGIEHWADYDVVFIGFPIWWGEEPRIMDTLAESYDFTGKTAIPFCTSGGSGIGSSGRNLEKLTSGATWLDGKRFASGVSADDILSWTDELGLPLNAG